MDKINKKNVKNPLKFSK